MKLNCQCDLLKDDDGRVFGFRLTSRDAQPDSERFCFGMYQALQTKNGGGVVILVHNHQLVFTWFDDDDHRMEFCCEVQPQEAEHIKALLANPTVKMEAVRMADNRESFRYNAVNWHMASQGN